MRWYYKIFRKIFPLDPVRAGNEHIAEHGFKEGMAVIDLIGCDSCKSKAFGVVRLYSIWGDGTVLLKNGACFHNATRYRPAGVMINKTTGRRNDKHDD